MTTKPVMIDREDFLDEFRQMMRPESAIRVMRLLGEGKMGKSHLMTKVLPQIIAERYPAYHCVVVDMRREAKEVPAYLHLLRTLLVDELGMPFPSFDSAYQQWLDRPKINVTGFKALLAQVSISARGEEDDARRFIPQLSSAFAEDLRKNAENTGKRIIILFDTVEQASASTQEWLMDTLLVHLARMKHVRVIVAGRQLPDANGSYAARCAHFELRPVKKEQAYIDYCRDHAPALEVSQIRVLAQAFDYSPGAFAEVLPKLRMGGDHV